MRFDAARHPEAVEDGPGRRCSRCGPSKVAVVAAIPARHLRPYGPRGGLLKLLVVAAGGVDLVAPVADLVEAGCRATTPAVLICLRRLCLWRARLPIARECVTGGDWPLGLFSGVVA